MLRYGGLVRSREISNETTIYQREWERECLKERWGRDSVLEREDKREGQREGKTE